MMDNIVWLGPIAWAVLYCSDYYLEYRRGVIFRASAFEILEFGVLYAFIYAFTPAGPFVLGGAFACAVLAMSHYRLARTRKEARVT
jgi:hypothetical protein